MVASSHAERIQKSNTCVACQKYLGWRRCREPCSTQRPLLAPLSRRSTPPTTRYPLAVPRMHRQPQSPALARPSRGLEARPPPAAGQLDLDLFAANL